jgi:hypothetical protein
MQKIGATLNLCAGDLVGRLNCRYLKELDLKVANGELEKPKVWAPVLEPLAERGSLQEQECTLTSSTARSCMIIGVPSEALIRCRS